jgi:glucose-6-phosphate 1-dehydrogenase
MSKTPLPLEEEGRATRNIDPCILVIFGATGDLTGRKLAPAIYNLGKDGMLPANFACVGFARRPKTHEAFREELKEDIVQFSRTKPIDEPFWNNFQSHLFYHQSEFDADEGYERLREFLAGLDTQHATRGNRIYYLSVQPKYFPLIIEKLSKHGLIYPTQENGPWSRVIIEKPFGHDSNSAAELQQNIAKHLAESQIYRIDHYLGKETVQNILVFRFANSIFESLWNYKHVDQVQITVAEDIGIGTRGHFFEEEGLLRDVVQNHMMQLLTLVAMEPPVSLSADAIRDEKVKVLKAIRPLKEMEVVRGQYGSGFIDGKEVAGYREESDVNPKSNVETFLAARLFIDNWRWAGVPFYLRGGKRLPKKGTEIAVIFKHAPGVLFNLQGHKNDPNVLAIRIQPDEGIAMKINCKVPGPSSPIQPVKMDFRYGSYFGQSPPEAYERLIWDCMLGDTTLFARVDEVEESWHIWTPALKYWMGQTQTDFPNYRAGSWGPLAADEMIAQDGRAWRIL